MGVFKWLRRERITVQHTSHRDFSSGPVTPERILSNINDPGTIRTDEYKRDLLEFQARRSSGNKDIFETPEKKTRCGRHSLPVSCTDCTTASPDKTFNYEKKSPGKYKKKPHKRTKSATTDEKVYETAPNIQFLFQNQVFMPGNIYPASYSDPQNGKKRHHRIRRSPDIEFMPNRQIDFREDEEKLCSPPLFYKNNSLPFDVKNFLDSYKSDENDSDALKGSRNEISSQSDNVDTPNNDSCEDKLREVISELKSFDQWADEQLRIQSMNSTSSEENKSDTSIHGLPLIDISNLDLSMDSNKAWSSGQWGVIPVKIKKLLGVNVDKVKKRENIEIEILKKCRHPNIVLLMGLYPDIHHNIYLICEQFLDTLYDILHLQGPILTVQKSVDYASDIASALVFLHMQGFVHSELSSASVVITRHDAAKLADLSSCVKYLRYKSKKSRSEKNYKIYSPEPEYVNIEVTQKSSNLEFEPLISQNPSETYLVTNAVAKDYSRYKDAEYYRWQAPELFMPDVEGHVYPCSKSDVYSLCLILWECCNAIMPWKSRSYANLKESYVLWKTGIILPTDGTYPGSLLELMQVGLKHNRSDRIDLKAAAQRLQIIKRDLQDQPDLIIPAMLAKKKSNFSSVGWGDNNSPFDSDGQSPKQSVQFVAVVHEPHETSTESDKDTPRESPFQKKSFNNNETLFTSKKCYTSEEDSETDSFLPPYCNKLRDNHEYSSACSTPISKVTARVKNIGTPGNYLHRSDSTEYCSILSPNRASLIHNTASETKGTSVIERPTTKLSRSFTPQLYKPLQIKVPDFGNLDSIKNLCKDQNETNGKYNFDIKNYSLPNTPIARSNKLRKNAWLSGDIKSCEKQDSLETSDKDPPQTPTKPDASLSPDERDVNVDASSKQTSSLVQSPESDFTAPDCYIDFNIDNNKPESSSPGVESLQFNNGNLTWSYKSTLEGSNSVKSSIEEDVLANVNVKPLVAIHERWIYEANRKTGRSMSLPEQNRQGFPSNVKAIQPRSLPQLNEAQPPHASHRSGSQSEHFTQVRDIIAKSMNFSSNEALSNRSSFLKSQSTIINEPSINEVKVDRSTDTSSIEEFIKVLIRKEFNHLMQEVSPDSYNKNDLINKGMTNVLDALKCDSIPSEQNNERENVQSFSRIKINGNNKPLLQITFTRNGENSLQVLDNCVNVTICDNNSSGKAEKLSQSIEETLTAEEFHTGSLKRCQTFNAIQEARSTEDLYIDDDLSTHMQENFGGRVKLIPLHGSLHEILCEKEDECCLIKVKQENGCDTIYFKCDNSDTESRDAIDGGHLEPGQDTVVYKRSISLVEERIQRVIPKDKRNPTPVLARTKKLSNDTLINGQPKIKVRPKSEGFTQQLCNEVRLLSSSTPSLNQNDYDKTDEVEVNLENVLSYQDSSSDECLKYQADTDEFEQLERKIEEDVANNSSCLANYVHGCLEKISEENLSLITDDFIEKKTSSIEHNQNVLY